MYKLYDSYPDSPALVGTFESVDEARAAGVESVRPALTEWLAAQPE